MMAKRDAIKTTVQSSLKRPNESTGKHQERRGYWNTKYTVIEGYNY